jgi:RHS repeat-associated protein
VSRARGWGTGARGGGVVSAASARKISDDSSAWTTTLATNKLRGTTRASKFLLTWLIHTEYDGAGRVAGVKNAANTSYYAGALASDSDNRIQYAEHGAVSAMKLGNGKWEHTDFNSRLQPTLIGLGVTGTDSSLLKLEYTYGASTNNGNVLTQKITAPKPQGGNLVLTQTYSYDPLNRLQTASEDGSPSWTQTYDIDRCGNRAVRSGSYIPTANIGLTPLSANSTDFSAFNQATNRLSNTIQAQSSVQYDAAGNLTRDAAGRTMAYDAENRLVNFNSGAGQYSYDGEGRRVKKLDGAGTTVFVYNVTGQLIAEYTSGTPSGGGTSYLTSDHLGSTRVVTKSDGTVKARYDYLPFGEEVESNIGGRNSVSGYGGADSTKQKFTQKERDNESGLDYFGARYYSSPQGRFTSVDNPRYAKATDPQTWNLYAYVRNGPLNKIDPDGRNWFRIGDHYEWHEGNKYTYKDDKDKTHTVRSNFTHLLVFERTGTNSQGALTGTLKLYEQNKVIATANAFSGGNRNLDIPPGNFMIRLDIRGKADSADDLKPVNPRRPNDRELKQFYGIQEIAPVIYDEQRRPLNGRWEWGSIRASLNEEPGENRQEYRGNYLHGKQRAGDYTHGCICNRDEHILNILLGLDYKQVPKVPVVVR